jgi:peptidoglycan hydrolase-like protein with peptidoglycan-binding domain
MYIYDVVTVDTAGPQGYTYVMGLVENGIECFEYQIGHCDPLVTKGTSVKKGDIIGTEANHGPVFSGNRQITLAEQKVGNREGAHQHHQKRPLKRADQPPHNLNKGYNFSNPINGIYYEIWDYFNGYNGCIDPLSSVFQRNLILGSSGYDVACLQRFLGITPTGLFWLATSAAVRDYQIKNGLSGVGVVGPQTRKLLANIA